MNPFLDENLQKRIRNYSLTSAAILAVAGTANAQVWGNDVNVTLTSGQSLSITFNGNTRFIIRHQPSGSYHQYLISEQTVSAQWISRGAGRAKALNSGYLVRSNAPSGWANSNNRFADKNTSSGFATGNSFFGTDKYIGVRFKISGQYHYGWILINVTGNAVSGITVKSYAFDETPNTSISANGTLPVELNNFTSFIKGNSVELKWNTATEVNNYGFEIERTNENQVWEKIGFVAGAGNDNSANSYTYLDNSVNSGKYKYRLKQIDLDGKFVYSREIETIVETDFKFVLSQNYPNPFNPSTMIKYQLAMNSHVKLKVFDMLGQEVATLINTNQKAGNYEINFDASRLASGIYIYKLTAGNYTETKKMNLLK